jgi:hypothetical protein
MKGITMNEQNFLKQIQGIVTGDGFVREVPIPLICLVNTNGTALALTSNVAAIYLQDDNDSVTFNFKVPLDYDEGVDELAVVLTAQLTTGDLSAGSNYITLGMDQVKRLQPGKAAAEDLTTAAATAAGDDQDVDDVVAAEYVFELSGLGLKVGDCLSIEVDAQETGTAEAAIYGASVRYRSDLVAHLQANREAIDEAVSQ